MPNLQGKWHDLHGSEVFALLEFCRGYWQIPLHKDSQDFQSFITPDGLYTSSRVLSGTKNATQHLQTVLFDTMNDIKSNIKVLLIACLLHTNTVDDCSKITFSFSSNVRNMDPSNTPASVRSFQQCRVIAEGRSLRMVFASIQRTWKRCRLCASRRTVPTWYSMLRQSTGYEARHPTTRSVRLPFKQD
jgi:hypothetical protein